MTSSVPAKPSPSQIELQDEHELRELVGDLLRRWRFILAIACILAALAAVKTLMASPTFAVTGQMYLDDGQDTQDSQISGNFLSDYQAISDVNTQVQLLQSPALIEQAVLETGLNADVRPLKAAAMPFWKWRFLHHRQIGVFAPGPGSLVARSATFADPAATGAQYQVSFGEKENFTVTTAKGQPQIIGTGVLGQAFSADGVSFTLESAEGVAPPAPGATYELNIEPPGVMANSVLDQLSVEAAGDSTSPTNVAQIRFVWPNPYQGQIFVKQLMADYIQRQLAWKTQSASASANYISGQLTKIGSLLSKARGNQANYQSQTGIIDADTNSQALTTQLNAYEAQRSTLKLQQEQLQSLVASVSGAHPNLDPYLFSQISDPVLSNLATTLATAQVKLQSLEAQFTAASPQVTTQRATIAQIKQAITVLLHNDLDAATKNLANINNMIAEYKQTLKKVPAESLEVGELSRSTDVLGTLYGVLIQKAEEAEVSKAAIIESTRVISPAELPASAFTPRPSLTVLAAFAVGLILGVAAVMIRRAFTGCFRSEAEVRALSPVPVLGRVPRLDIAGLPEQVMASVDCQMLKRKLLELRMQRALHVILVTAAGDRDGRSAMAVALASALAADGKRVILADADLHARRLSTLLNLLAGPGLSDWLDSSGPLPLHRLSSAGLAVLAAGTVSEQPGKLFTPDRLAEAFSALREQCDLVVIDTPPLPAMADTLALLPHADLVLSAVTVDKTLRLPFMNHCEIIRETGCPHGLVISAIPLASGRYGGPHQADPNLRRRWHTALQARLGAIVARSWRRRPAWLRA